MGQMADTGIQAAAGPFAPSGPEDEALLAKYSATFIGTYYHTLDNKGRIIVPGGLRENLGETFCVGPSFDFSSIALYPTLVWARMREQYARLGSFDRSLNRFLEQFDALSYRDQECDAQGRVLLPTRIRQKILGEEKEVEIAGATDHIRIVARVESDDRFEAFKKDLPDILDAIGRLSMGADAR